MGMWADYIRFRAGKRAIRRDQRFRARVGRELWLVCVLILMIVGWPLYRLWKATRAGAVNAGKAGRTTLRLIAPGPIPTVKPTRRTPKQRTMSGRWSVTKG